MAKQLGSAVRRRRFMISFWVFWIGLLLCGLDATDAQTGVCYGRRASVLPPPGEVVELYKQRNIRRMRIYSPDKDALDALRGSDIELILDLPKDNVQTVASSQAEADNWVRDNVRNYASDVRFRYIAVGNEVKPSDPAAGSLLEAMRKIETAISGVGGNIKVSTAIEFGSVEQSSPPSAGEFRPEYRQILDPILGFLAEKQSPLLVNLYPYFAYADDAAISLDYALFRAKSPVVSDPPLSYDNLFDAQLDSVYAAIEKTGKGSLEVVVSESGWPTAGGRDTNVENARTYNNNMVQHVKRGSPKKPNTAVETYIFAMFDENKKDGAEVERHWGIFSPDKQPKYDVNFN